MKIRSLLPLFVSGLIWIPNAYADSDKRLSIYLSRETENPNYEAGLFYAPIGDEELKLGLHASLRSENNFPYLAKVMFGAGVGIEREFGFLKLGGKAQGYIANGGEIDSNNDGHIDSSAGIGLGRIFQFYAARNLFRSLDGIVALSNKSLTFNSTNSKDISVKDNAMELGLRLRF